MPARMSNESRPSDDPPESEFEKPRCLLPDGCKDLIEVLRVRKASELIAMLSDPPEGLLPSGHLTDPGTIESLAAALGLKFSQVAALLSQPPIGLPCVALPDPVTIDSLAAALGLKPSEIVGILAGLDDFTSHDGALDFATASAVCSLCGVAAQKLT